MSARICIGVDRKNKTDKIVTSKCIITFRVSHRILSFPSHISTCSTLNNLYDFNERYSFRRHQNVTLEILLCLKQNKEMTHYRWYSSYLNIKILWFIEVRIGRVSNYKLRVNHQPRFSKIYLVTSTYFYHKFCKYMWIKLWIEL